MSNEEVSTVHQIIFSVEWVSLCQISVEQNQICHRIIGGAPLAPLKITSPKANQEFNL